MLYKNIRWLGMSFVFIVLAASGVGMLFFKSKSAPSSPERHPSEPIVLRAHTVVQSLPYAAHLGQDFRYSLAVPSDIDERQNVPVIMYLHGKGGNENSELMSFTHYVETAIEACGGPQPLIVFPGDGNHLFQLDQNYHLAEGILNELAKDYALAGVEGRIIVGFSFGGAAATRTALVHPNRFALSVSWAGGVWPKDSVLFEATQNNRMAFEQSGFKPHFFIGLKDAPKQYVPLWRILDDNNIAYEKNMLKGQKHDLGQYLSRTQASFKALLCAQFANLPKRVDNAE